MAVGRTIDVKWIHEGKLYTGDFCTAQGKLLHEPFAKSLNSFVKGAVQQLGETGSALATLVGSFVFFYYFPESDSTPVSQRPSPSIPS